MLARYLSACIAVATLITTALGSCEPSAVAIYVATDGINTYQFNLGEKANGPWEGSYITTVVDGHGAETTSYSVTIADGKAVMLDPAGSPCAVWSVTSIRHEGFKVRAGADSSIFRLSNVTTVGNLVRQTELFGSKYHFVVFPQLESPFNKPCGKHKK